MRDYFEIDGVSSRDFGVYVAETNQFDAAERDVELVSVPGRNGTLTIDNGRFNNMTKYYKAYIPVDTPTNIEGMRAWLLSTSAYRKLKDTLHPEEYYKARYVSGLEVELSDRVGSYFTIEFDRMPQRFLDSGEQAIDISAATKIMNRYRYSAKPLIRAYGTGTFTLNGRTVRITAADSYTDIDCELQEAYKDTVVTSKNSNVVLVNGSFPEIGPGENAVSMSGITRLIITPRWWTI